MVLTMTAVMVTIAVIMVGELLNSTPNQPPTSLLRGRMIEAVNMMRASISMKGFLLPQPHIHRSERIPIRGCIRKPGLRVIQ